MKKRLTTVASASNGSASWIVTFADLMTLLLTFFILLLSFSKLDADKYRRIAYSMSQAFGVPWAPQSQTEPAIPTDWLPQRGDDPQAGKDQHNDDQSTATREEAIPSQQQMAHYLSDLALEQNDGLASALIAQLEQEISEQALAIRFDEKGVIISFTEKASFPSGSVELRQYMRPVLLKVVDQLANCSGDIKVVGHTDDQPVQSGRFRSNWDLSAARAVSVVHQLVLDGRLNARRVSAVGLAETKPLVPNSDAENRAKNRRVEVLIENAACDF